MRDGGGEARSKLFVGGEISRVGEVEQRLVRPSMRYGTANEWAPASSSGRERLALADALERLARAPARCDDVAVGVEHDHELAALLDQHSPALCLELESSGLVFAPSRLWVASRFILPPVCRRGTSSRREPVLIVEDDEVIAGGMARHLAVAGFDPLWVDKGEAGIARLRFERPDVCVLDLMLPGLDGWRLIEPAREEGIGTPIVVVTARGTEHDRVHALEIGADDYLVKPFSMKELVARVRAAARRGMRAADPPRGEPIEIEELEIDPRNVQARVGGEAAS